MSDRTFWKNVDGFVYMLFTNSQHFNQKKAFEMYGFQSPLQEVRHYI